MLQTGGDRDLAVKPVRAECRAEFGPQHLKRNPAAVLEVFGEVYRGHPAPAELTLDPVALAESRLEVLEQVQDLGS